MKANSTSMKVLFSDSPKNGCMTIYNERNVEYTEARFTSGLVGAELLRQKQSMSLKIPDIRSVAKSWIGYIQWANVITSLLPNFFNVYIIKK